MELIFSAECGRQGQRSLVDNCKMSLTSEGLVITPCDICQMMPYCLLVMCFIVLHVIDVDEF